MARKLLPLPASTTSPVMGGAPYSTSLYAYLKGLEAVILDQAAQIEKLRVALNETRQTPATAYPPLPPF